MEDKIDPPLKEVGGVDIKELFFKYIRFLPLFLLSVALALTAAFLYLRYATPIYKSTGQIVLNQGQARSVGGAGGEGDRFTELFVDDRSSNTQNEIEYLKSVPLNMRVVDSLNLNTLYYVKGKIKETNVYRDSPFELDVIRIEDSSTFEVLIDFIDDNRFKVNGKGSFGWGQEFKTDAGSFRLISTGHSIEKGQYRALWRNTKKAASEIISNLSVAPKPSGSILLISLEMAHKDMAADVVNKLMRIYQVAIIEDKNKTTLQTLEFIDGRLAIVSRELDSLTADLVGYMQRSGLLEGGVDPSGYETRVQETQLELNTQNEQVRNLDLLKTYLQQQNKFNLVPSIIGNGDQALSGLVGSFNSLQMERKTLLESGGAPNNPRVKLLEGQMENVRNAIYESIRNLQNIARFNIATIEAKNAAAQGRLRTMPAKQQVYVEKKRQQDNKLQLYTFLTAKREDLAVSLAATISNTKVLEDAVSSSTPVNPKATNVKLVAIVIGLIIPALFVFILEFLDDKIASRKDIEKHTSVTVIGEVGHAASDETLVVTPASRTFVAEQFRIIRSNLQYVLTKTPNPVVLVTSSFSGEGKSFISTNLGAVMALGGKRTIILEFDVRKPKILSGLNMPKSPGLSNYLLGKMEAHELPIQVAGNDNLFVLPCGPVPPNPAEILLEPRLKDLFTYLRQAFDVVIMDTAPAGMVSDALALSQFADATIYMVRQGVTPKKQLELVNEFYTSNKLPRMNLILNDIKPRGGYGYYGYGRYSYGYGYGYGYGGGNGYGYYDVEKSRPGLLKRWFGIGAKKKTPKRKKADTI